MGRKNALILAFIFLAVFISHVKSPNITSFDSKWSIHVAMSIINEGNTDLDEYKELIPNDDYRVQRINGHTYSIFPVGTYVLAVPFVYLLEKTGPLFSFDLDEHLKHDITRVWIERFVASLIIAFTAVFVYLIARLFLDTKYSLLLTFIFAFCTSAWSTGSRGLWQHGPTMLMLSMALYFILLAKNNPKLIQFASIPLAFCYVVRPTNSISVLLLTFFVFIQYRKYFFRYFLWALAVAIPFFAFNLLVYHALLSPYYHGDLSGSFSTQRVFNAFPGNLISPSRGLFIFTPIFLFSIWGIILKIRQKRFEKLDYFLAGSILLHLTAISLLSLWWGGWCYGPRYMSDMIPYFIYFLIPAMMEISRSKGGKKAALAFIFICLLIISFFVHYRGATNWDVYEWNSKPVNVDKSPERVWDWHDVQFLRGLTLNQNGIGLLFHYVRKE